MSPNPITLPGQSQTLGYLLRTVYAALQQRVYAAVAAAGHPDVREAHSSVLRHLEPDGSRVADLARRCGLTKQSVAYLVDDLAALGYLEIVADPDDGRAKRVSPTARGRALMRLLVAESERAQQWLAEAVGPARVESLRATLALITDRVGSPEQDAAGIGAPPRSRRAPRAASGRS